MGKVVGFGELMVRLMPPGYLKILQADSFEVNYTGAEANVLVSLSQFGLETDFVTLLPNTEIGDAAIGKLRSFGVGVGNVHRGGERIGLYYLERGASQRPSKVVYDRKYSAISAAQENNFDWESIFKDADWFHFSGITAALSEKMPGLCREACQAAKAHNVPISCDLNYRKNLWSSDQAIAVMSKLVPYIDVLIGNEEDAEQCLGIAPENTDIINGKLNHEAYAMLASRIADKYPNISKIAFTLRTSISASDNKWSAMLYQNGKAYYSLEYVIHLIDRVGGGDSFSAGLIYALLKDYSPGDAIDFAAAASCLKQTIERDFNLSSVDDVHKLMQGDGSGRVQR